MKSDCEIGCQNAANMADNFRQAALEALEQGNTDSARYAAAFASGLDLAVAMIDAKYSEQDIKDRLKRAGETIDQLARNSQLNPTTQAHSG